jgi:hypothetical protein
MPQNVSMSVSISGQQNSDLTSRAMLAGNDKELSYNLSKS